MNARLDIRPDGELDFVSLGALVHRLDPGVVPFRKARHFDVHVSGGEFNVAANLADCFRLRAGIRPPMDYPIGELVAERVRAMGVRPFYRHFHGSVRHLTSRRSTVTGSFSHAAASHFCSSANSSGGALSREASQVGFRSFARAIPPFAARH